MSAMQGVNVKTVGKWVKRYKKDGLQGLKDQSRRPHRSHRKVTPELEKEILLWRDRTGFGARRMRMELGFDLTAATIHKILRRNGRVKPRRRSWRSKRDLRSIKHKLRPFQKVQMDSVPLEVLCTS